MGTPAKTDAKEAVLDREPITTVGTLGAELLELVERPVVTWRPDKGDAAAIAGRVVGVSTTLSTFGAYPIIEVDDGATVWRVHGLGQVFASEVEFRPAGEGVYTTKLAVGDLVAFSDHGERKEPRSPGRQPYRVVRVVHRPLRPNVGPTATANIVIDDSEIPY